METNIYNFTKERRRGALIQPKCEKSVKGHKQFHKAELPVISENLLLTLTVGGDA